MSVLVIAAFGLMGISLLWSLCNALTQYWQLKKEKRELRRRRQETMRWLEQQALEVFRRSEQHRLRQMEDFLKWAQSGEPTARSSRSQQDSSDTPE